MLVGLELVLGDDFRTRVFKAAAVAKAMTSTAIIIPIVALRSPLEPRPQFSCFKVRNLILRSSSEV